MFPHVCVLFLNPPPLSFVVVQPGLAAQMLSAAEERPWLWVVYVLTVALPLILIFVFCCTGKVKHRHTQGLRLCSIKLKFPHLKVEFLSCLK